MSLNIVLYVNSSPAKTIGKTLGSARTITGILLEDVEDITAPRIELDSTVTTVVSGKCNWYTANYCYISKFDRYYFITKKTIVDNDHFVVGLRCDVLESFKTDIKAATLYVSRSQSAGSWYIPDGSVPLLSEMTVSQATIPSFTPFNISPDVSNADDSKNPATFVLCAAGTRLGTKPQEYIKNGYQSVNNMCCYWVLTEKEVQFLAEEVSNGSGFVQNWFQDLASGVFGLKAFPFSITRDRLAGDVIGLYYGDCTPGTTGSPLHSLNHTVSYYGLHSANWGPVGTAQDFRNSTGHCVIRIFLPFVGWQTLDPMIMKERPYINIEYKTSLITGSGVCTIYALANASSPSASTDIIAQFEYVAGIDIPITISNYRDIVKSGVETTLTSALAIAGSVATKNPALIGGAISSAAVNNAQAWGKELEYGQLGTSSNTNNPLYQQSVIIQYRTQKSPILDSASTKTAFASAKGIMCQKVLSLSGLTGYTVADGDLLAVPASCTDSEYQEICGLLQKGVIIA